MIGSKYFIFRNMLFAALFLSILVAGSSVSAGDDREVTLRYSLEEGTVLKYKGSNSMEMNWKGIAFNNTHGDEIELSWVEDLENGKQRVEVKYVACSDRRQMGGAAAVDYDSPIKPEGRSVKITVGPDGRLEDAAGFILGIKGAGALKGYLNRWFFELPEGPLKAGSKWTVNVPREDEEKDEEEESGSDVRGAFELELKKFDNKNGIDVAVIEFKSKLIIHNESDQGVMDGESNSKGEVMVALDGGYVVEYKNSSEMKGKVVSLDEVSSKETTADIVQARNSEFKLQK